MSSRERDLGLRLIVGYKFGKAAIEVTLGLALLLFAERASNDVRNLALHFRDHATAAWSIALAGRLWNAATERHLHVVAAASLVDGAFSALEGWALRQRYRWSEWLVIVATSCLLPFEVAALVRRFTVGRLILLTVNTAIVAYLVRRSRRAHRQRVVGL
jgi:uncharacterized membrane protein (DUF2068 family)